MIKIHTAFNDIPFSTPALKLAKEKIASVHPSERRYLESAFSDEYDSIKEAMEKGGEFHDYMLVSDVQRVLEVFNLNKHVQR